MVHVYNPSSGFREEAAPSGHLTLLTLVGRVLLALMFVMSGASKLGNIQGTAAFIASAGLVFPTTTAALVGIFEFVAGLAVAIGWRARPAALALGVFTVIASVVFHAFWKLAADQQLVQQLMFMKNLSIAGAMFFLAAVGAGRASLDARRSR